MQRTLASLILFLAAAPLWAQIELAPEHRLGQRIIATTPFEAKVYDWTCPTADVMADGGKAFVWAREGKHTITLIAVTEGYELKRWEKTFEVTSDPTPPTPATLRDLVTDDEAKLIAAYLRTLASQVASIQSAEHFWAVWNSTTAAGFPVRGNAKLDAALKSRIEPALEAKKGLSTVLIAIADEFAKPGPKPPEPPKPPVTEGKRQVVIAYATEEPSTEIDSLVVQLRKPGTSAQSFLANAGHTLDALDDETIRESKWNTLLGGKLSGLPKLFIIDPNTNAILFEQTIASGTTADNITERIRETGG